MSATTTANPMRELAYRENHGLRVTLLWSARHDNLLVVVDDVLADQRFEIDAPSHAALHVFHHPFVYLGSARTVRTAHETPTGTAA